MRVRNWQYCNKEIYFPDVMSLTHSLSIIWAPYLSHSSGVHMKLLHLRTGPRVVASFTIVLLIMACMSAVSLWRLQTADDNASSLVNDKLAKQQLTSELVGASQLNGIRAVSIARGDSLEVSEYFQAQLTKGEKVVAGLEAKLNKLPQDGKEKVLFATVAEKKRAYLALRNEMLQFKEVGKIQEVATIVDTKLDVIFGAYIKALDDLLDYQTLAAHTLATESGNDFQNSRNLLVAFGIAALLIGSTLAWLLTRSIVAPLKQAVDFAARVAGGDLSTSVQHRRTDEIGQLLNALGEMAGRLALTVAKVRDGALAIDNASREVASGNLSLSQRTEHQAGTLEETAASMDELTATVRQNTSNARQADQLAISASAIAVKGGVVVADVVETMSVINDFAHKIVDITSVIDGIAFQTNILALNAAVEAARAGEQGRGFAVVAAEVRNLAQRSATAAREIKKLISDSTEKIEAGSQLAGTAGATMTEIVASVERVSAIISAISAAGAEQENGISQINAAIADLDSDTQQNAAMVEEAAAAADAMHLQANELTMMVSSFKLDASHGQQPVEVKTAASRRAPAPKRAVPALGLAL